MLIPIAATAAILGGMYYYRPPVTELVQNKRYRIGVNFNANLFPLGGAADLATAAKREIPQAIQNDLTAMGFGNVVFVSGPKVENGIYTYWFDGTWTKPEKYVTMAAPNAWVGISVFDKLF